MGRQGCFSRPGDFRGVPLGVCGSSENVWGLQKCFGGSQGTSRLLQKISGVFRGLHGVSEGSRMFRWCFSGLRTISGNLRGFSESPIGVPGGLRGVSGASRGFQVAPVGLRSLFGGPNGVPGLKCVLVGLRGTPGALMVMSGVILRFQGCFRGSKEVLWGLTGFVRVPGGLFLGCLMVLKRT